MTGRSILDDRPQLVCVWGSAEGGVRYSREQVSACDSEGAFAMSVQHRPLCIRHKAEFLNGGHLELWEDQRKDSCW